MSIQRFDRVSWDLNATSAAEREAMGLTKKFEKTADGCVEGKAAVTNVGVFSYRQPDGTMRRELRPPEEVFDDASLSSLKNVPLTNDHPSVGVTDENIRDVKVGSLGTTIEKDAYRVYATIRVDDKNAIAAIKNGKQGLSCGYTCDMEETAGTWMGVKYDAIQRNIRYNHVALVQEGRAGDDARISVGRLDSAHTDMTDAEIEKLLKESEELEKSEKGDKLTTEKKTCDKCGKEMTSDKCKNDKCTTHNQKDSCMKSVKIDGVDYEAEAKVVETLVALQARADKADELEKELESSKAKLDSANEQLESAKKELEGSIKADSLDALVASRIALLDTAKAAGVEVKADTAEIDIKKAVIAKAFPKADLADKSETYIEARFDSAKEVLAESIEQHNLKQQGSSVVDRGDSSDSDTSRQDSADDARARMIKAQQTAHIRKES